MKIRKPFIFALIGALFFPLFTHAISFDVAEDLVLSETINDDYYIGGGTIKMQNDVHGDLIGGGGEVYIESKITQDLMMIGGNMMIMGEVGDDARLGGGNISLSATIKDDLIVGGGNVDLTKNSFVGGDVIFGAGNININGLVNGNVTGAGGTIQINGVINGDVTLKNIEDVIFRPDGKVLGNFYYASPRPSKYVTSESVQGEIEFKEIEPPVDYDNFEVMASKLWGAFSVFKFLALLFTGLFFVWLFRFYVTNTVKTCYKKPFQSMGVGFLILVLTPIAAFIFLVTTIGYSMAYVVMISFLLVLFIGKLIAIMMIGMLILKPKDKSGFLKVYGTFAIGALIYSLLCMVPIVGWVAKFLLILMGMGALSLYEYKLFTNLRKEKLV